MSLLKRHPMLGTVTNCYDVNKMVIKLRMLSGRYRVGSLLRHFIPLHSGLCELCDGKTILRGTDEIFIQFLLDCSVLPMGTDMEFCIKCPQADCVPTKISIHTITIHIVNLFASPCEVPNFIFQKKNI